MSPTVFDRPGIGVRILVSYLWTLAIANLALAATLFASECRSAAILGQFGGLGARSSIASSLLNYILNDLGPMLLKLEPLTATLAALGVADYFIGCRAKPSPQFLKRRLIFGWLPALLLSFLMYDFIFLVAPIWAVAVVPASMDLYRGLRWRAVECVAFSIVTVLSLGFPLT